MELNHYFISDTSNVLRGENIKKQAAKLGITPRVFPAVMGCDMSEEERTALAPQPPFMSPGEIGCALSHLGIYKALLSHTDEPLVWIFEDDCVFSDDFTPENIERISSFIEKQKKPAVLILQKNEHHFWRAAASYSNLKIYQAYNLVGMYGYVINRSAAENILRLHTPRLRFEIDTFDFYWKLNTCHLFCIDRQLVGHDDSVLGGSLIAGGEMRHPPARQKNKPLQFQTLYRELSLGGKIRCLCRRLQKALHKPFIDKS